MALQGNLLDLAQQDYADLLTKITWDAGLSISDPRNLARMAVYDDSIDATAFGDMYQQRIPIRRRPGFEVGDGIFVERDEVQDAYSGSRRMRYRIDLSEWDGDKDGVYIPKAGECAKRAGLDPIQHVEFNEDLYARGMNRLDVQELEIAQVKAAVDQAKVRLTDKLLERMGTTRSQVMEEHYEHMAKAQQWADYHDGYLARHPIMPKGLDDMFWEHTRADAAKLEEERRMRERERAEAKRIAEEKREIEKLAREADEIAAIEGNNFYGAWG